MNDKRIVLRFSVSVDTSPELFRALRDLSGRSRSERLRTLATLGVAALHGDTPTGRPSPAVSPARETPDADDRKNRKRDELASDLAARLFA